MKKNIPEFFRNWAIYSTLLASRRWPNVPGAIVQNASDAIREVLKTIKSDDLAFDTNFKEYWEMFSSKKWETKKIIEKLLLEFDNKILK